MKAKVMGQAEKQGGQMGGAEDPSIPQEAIMILLLKPSSPPPKTQKTVIVPAKSPQSRNNKNTTWTSLAAKAVLSFGKMSKMSTVLSWTLVALGMLLVSFFLVKILKIMKNLNSWLTLSVFPWKEFPVLSKVLGTKPCALCQIVPMDMSSISLGVSQAFYHLPLHPLSATGLCISN